MDTYDYMLIDSFEKIAKVIRKNPDEFDWNFFCWVRDDEIPRWFIAEFYSHINWFFMCSGRDSEVFISIVQDYADRIDWKGMSFVADKLTEKFILTFADRFNWYIIRAMNVTFSENAIFELQMRGFLEID